MSLALHGFWLVTGVNSADHALEMPPLCALKVIFCSYLLEEADHYQASIDVEKGVRRNMAFRYVTAPPSS